MDIRNLFQHAHDAVSFAAGAAIFEQGQDAEHMYVVLDGEVEIRLGDALLSTAGPGDIVGEMALIDKSPRSAAAVARTDCQLVAVDQRRFLFLVGQTPFFALHVMRQLAERIRRKDEAD
jgi:CRP/FNR family cyclic AMP-dependent transcriptional regulator